jgi:hypothetical protein
MNRRIAELDESKLDHTSQMVLREFAEHPLRRCSNLQMDSATGRNWSLLISIQSQTGDRRRDISIWLDEKGIPSIEFGGWHTHADLWDDDLVSGLRKMLAYLERIAIGEIVLAETPTVGDGIPFQVVDLCDREAVLEELTSPRKPANMKLLSWSGAGDCELGDLQAAPL